MSATRIQPAGAGGNPLQERPPGNAGQGSSTLQGGAGNQKALRINSPSPGVKNKELCLIPEKLIVALQEDGWWVRRDIIWAKDTCMPESALDRPTTAHEYLWILTKRPKYF